MEISNLIPHIEALIFASEKPLTTLEITDLINNAFGFMEDKITLDQIESAIEGILEKYRAEFYPFEVRESGGGWQFLTKKDYHKTVGQLNGDRFLKRLSTAALETLSIIAYKQPVTKGDIESIRGVSSDYAIQKLLEKDLIVITGRNENMPGHPLVYCTSKNFMDYFGLNSPEDLPKLKEVFDDNFVLPTAISDEALATQNPEGETDEPSLNGIGLNGTHVDIAVEEESAEGGDVDETTITDDAGDEETGINAEEEEAGEEELADSAYNAIIEDAMIEEEAEALDEEAGEVLDEIAEDMDEEEEYEEGELAEDETDEPYITPEEEEFEEEDNGTTFKVGEDGELIEEQSDDTEEEGDDEAGDDEEEEEDDNPEEDKK